MTHPNDTIPAGYCQCGCGLPTKIAPRTDAQHGWVKGQPLAFLRGHGNRKNKWVEEDRGYTTPCHIWNGNKGRDGYGRCKVPGSGERQRVSAHRVRFEQRFGPVPAGMVLDHLCRQPDCTNPEHLEVVTVAVNTQRGSLVKLNPDLVREMRERYPRDTITQIAKEFGVERTTAHSVIHRKTWKNVA